MTGALQHLGDSDDTSSFRQSDKQGPGPLQNFLSITLSKQDCRDM